MCTVLLLLGGYPIAVNKYIILKYIPFKRYFFRAFSSVVRQMPGYKPQRQGTARILKKFLCCSLYCFVSFCVLFVGKCVLYYCHRVATQLQLTNIYVRLKAKENSACTTEFLRCWYVFVPCISGNGPSPGLLIAFRGNAALL